MIITMIIIIIIIIIRLLNENNNDDNKNINNNKQAIPYVSSLSPITTLFPILVVLSVTLVKDLYDDIVSEAIQSNFKCK